MKKRSMFETYDNPNKKIPRPINIYELYKNRQVGSANTSIIRDVKGKEIGVSAKEGSTFTIYFSFSGDDNLRELLYDMIFGCEVYNHRHQLVARPSVTVYLDDLVASIEMSSEKNGELCKGNYAINLFMTDAEDIIYPLFTGSDGILAIE